MRCPNPACRAELRPDAKFCGKCGTIIESTPPSAYASPSAYAPPSPAPSPAAAPRRTAARPLIDTRVNTMPQGIALGVGEQIVKQYKIGRYTFRKGSIDVIVTNKRVIRYEESTWLGMQNNQIDEINIDAVHGVTTHMRRSISILGMIFALIFFIVSMVFLFGNIGFGYYGKSAIEYVIGFAALAACAVIVISSLKPSLVFTVQAAIGNPALATVVNLHGRFMRSSTGGIIMQFKPTPETTVMLKEIGACVYDIKTLGDAAISKWM